MEIETKGHGGARVGAGRKRTAPDGEIRKQHQLRAADEEWELIREFAQLVKKDMSQAKDLLARIKSE